MQASATSKRLPPERLPHFVERMKELAQRRPQWKVVDSLELDFDTDHPQGLVKIEDNYYLSTVKKKGWFRPGAGYLLKFDNQGRLLDRLELGDEKRYHPGGIDFDGESLWVSVAEYKPDSSTTVYRVDPQSMEAEEAFQVQDHIGAITRDPDSGHLHGVSWGSKRLYEWTPDGETLDTRSNPNREIAYQDWKFAGEDMILSSGLQRRRAAGLELVQTDGELVARVPIKMKSPKGKPMTQNPMTFRYDEEGIRLYVVPDDDESQLFILEPTSSD